MFMGGNFIFLIVHIFVETDTDTIVTRFKREIEGRKRNCHRTRFI